MSPRAALRLEHSDSPTSTTTFPVSPIGRPRALPHGGHSSHIPNAGDVVHTDILTCYFRDRLSAARKSMEAEGSGFCVAFDEDRIVVGMLYSEDARGQPADATVEEAMRFGPTTIRANEPLEPLLERMKSAKVDGILVTDPEGRLLGLLDRHKAEEELKGRQADARPRHIP